MSRRKRVALLIETSSSYGRGLLEGVVRFMRVRDDWSVFLELRDLAAQPPTWLDSWDGDGVLSRVTTPAVRAAAEAAGVPLVDLTDRRPDAEGPAIRSDDAAIGRAAADHLLERGFRSLGVCGFDGEAWAARRERAFAARVLEAHGPDAECPAYRSPWPGPDAPTWEEDQARIGDWLTKLEPPFAVFCVNDPRGHQVLTACGELGLDVPEEAAVLGVDNDELLCRVGPVSMSSVRPNTEAIGYRAAERLDALMRGEAPGGGDPCETVPPLGVVLRQSTDVVAIEDPRIASALRYIRQNAGDGITVEDVVKATGVSRSTLERQVRRHLGRTPQEEIRSVQVDRVRDLLLTTDLPADQIAGLAGFKHAEYMHVVFRRVTGQTPGAFRKSSQS